MFGPARVCCIAVVLFAVAGCDEVLDRVGGDASGDAMLAVESAALTETEAASVVAVVDGIDLSGTEGEIAQRVADAASSTYSPSDCVTAIAAGGTVTYDFDDCSGPRGLVGLNGNAVATFAVPADDSIAVTFLSNDFVANGTEVTLNAQGEYSQRGGEQELILETAGGGVTDAGDVVTRVGSYNVTWDDTCLTIVGGWTTQEGATNYNTSVTGYTTCAGGCPEDGGRIVFTELDSDEVELSGSATTVSFDGDGDASYLGTAGAPGALDLACE